MRPEWTIVDAIFTFSMHLKRTLLMVQKDAAKEVYKYRLEHSGLYGSFDSSLEVRWEVPCSSLCI